MFSSPNRMVWTYFDLLRRIAGRIHRIATEREMKDEVVLSQVMAVAAVEVFLNAFFRVLVDETGYEECRDGILADLDPDKAMGLRSKLNHWPPKVLGKSINWRKDMGKKFAELLARRNVLMHFQSSHETISLPDGVTLSGMAASDVYDGLKAEDATEAVRIAEGMVAEIFRLKGVPPEGIAANLHGWTGKPPIPPPPS